MSNNNVSVQFWYLHSQLKGLTLSQVTSWIVICIKSNEASNYTIIKELINQLWHVYNNSESRKRVTCILKALKQKEKPFVKHLIIFEQTLLKMRGLKWDDTVKKTFLSNSLNVMFMQALIVTSIFVLYNEYIICWNKKASWGISVLFWPSTRTCCVTWHCLVSSHKSHVVDADSAF